ncbi:hypothetical protein GJ496_009230 [Pomphorhynchus laevis]|nr:hypothetical protein GJ496_009230 [Pomphorhynchus laevis]
MTVSNLTMNLNEPGVLMRDIAAPLDNDLFEIEIALKNQLGAVPLPFTGMDKSGSPVCEFFINSPSGCNRGSNCPFRHIRGDKSIVCKHWLRGLCKKGDECEFLHEYDISRMPECYFFSKFGQCMNKECIFLHLDPESKIRDCPWYDRGFCRHGPHCKNRHVRRTLCQSYLAGFCPHGTECQHMHPSFDLPTAYENLQGRKVIFVCEYCKELGHKASTCFKLSPEERTRYLSSSNSTVVGYPTPVNDITCFKCGEKGHYANRCVNAFKFINFR